MSIMSSESSADAALPKSWKAFVALPDDTTARAVAQELEKDPSPDNALASVRLIAETLAQRSAQERSTMSEFIVRRLTGDLARGFLKATAAVRLAHPALEKPKEKPTPQHADVRHSLDLLKPETPKTLTEKLAEKTSKTPEEISKTLHLEMLDALDLAAGGKGKDKVTVDLVELAQRVEDESDASSMGHLRAVARLVDSISGKAAYSKERRGELEDITKGTTQQHLVEQIGFRAAKSQRSSLTGLSTQNELAASYWRTNFRDTLDEFLKKLRGSGESGKGGALDELVQKLTKVGKSGSDVLVNSPRVLNKLQIVLGPEVLENLTITPLVGRTGVSVLSGTGAYTKIEWDKILYELGATPSAYQLYELMDTGKTPPTSNFEVDTRADLVRLITSSRFSRLQEIARGKSEIAPVCAMVEHLVLGLTDALGPKRFDALTANALGSLSRLIDIVVENEANPTVAMRAADLMMDEIAIVVAVAQYYTGTDYRTTMRDILLERAKDFAKAAGDIQIDSYLMTSGMDALATALYIALSWRDHEEVSRSTEAIDYYETAFLLGKLKKGEKATPHKDVLVAALNPSTPAFAPSPAKLVDDVRRSLETHKKGDAPFALIIDTTIEIAPETAGKTQIDILLDGLKDAVAAGKLEIFLCKSFQKYASMGTGKVAAGNLTMLSAKGNSGSAYARAEALLQDIDLDLVRHDEGQLVVHMLKHGHRDELALVRSAARNAKFVDEFCWPIDSGDLTQGTTYVDGIPLILRTTPTGDVDKLFNKLQIDRRDSFSFLRTSYVGEIPSAGGVEGKYVRINTGHESKATMVEYFYAFGHLARSTPPGAKKPGGTKVDLGALTIDVVKEHLEVLGGVRNDQDPGIAEYRDNIVASYCAFALQNVPGKGAVMPLLLEFFVRPVSRVTIETQRYLADALLTFKAKDLGTNPVALASLCRAAVVLPASRIKSLTPVLRLDTIGESEEAKQLRAIVTRKNKV
ncbi:hypothetical protein [Microbispora triticiradicis]|uniref:Uncharacterized protein n=2 Tax=Microbispora TaxID=2005 RepID=A0ABY3M048_9ACTN|nr:MULTISPECIES: hypothetical protein [Microbispora]TLP60695.1 hypothetical protein FED44_12445 [Microbispora fusca]TYB61995.1 hypothetical protein FXF59_11095 [Microbispora tritici]